MEFDIQLFGGRGSGSGGSFRGSAKPPWTNPPNSSYTWIKDGKPKQKRWYDKDGKAKRDKDFDDHGRPDKHPKVPHYHDWKDGERGDGYYWDKEGNKKYFDK